MAMFKKAGYDDRLDIASPARSRQTRSVRSKNRSVIEPTLAIKGDLSALVIEGHIEGTIAHHKKHLTVGEQGRVKADIHASSVIVLGQLIGDIHSEGIVSLLRKYLHSVQGQLKAEDRSKIVQAVADVIKSDTQINVLEIDFFYQVANALRITLDEPLGLTT